MDSASQTNQFVSMLFVGYTKGIIDGIITLASIWQLWTALLFLATLKLLPIFLKKQKYKAAGMAEIDNMNGEEFEQFLVTLFTTLGYRVEHIGKMGDYGGDLIVEKDGIKTMVQAKRQKYKVKEAAVQQAIAAKEYYKCDKAMVITNNYYYWHAWNLGKMTGTTLWTRKELANAIIESKKI